jgi:hypothetical protein
MDKQFYVGVWRGINRNRRKKHKNKKVKSKPIKVSFWSVQTGRPDLANFRTLCDCAVWPDFWKWQN